MQALCLAINEKYDMEHVDFPKPGRPFYDSVLPGWGSF